MNKNISLTPTEYMNVIRATKSALHSMRYRVDDLLDENPHEGNDMAAGVVADLTKRLGVVEHALAEYTDTPTAEGMWWDYNVLRPLELALGQGMDDEERDKLTPYEIHHAFCGAVGEVLAKLKALKQEMNCFAWADGARRKRFIGSYLSNGHNVVNRDETPVDNLHIVTE